MFHRMRLSEVGIDNAQNSAKANIIELLLETPFNSSQLIDWIAQAKLYLYFRSNIDVLREAGIRTVFDLKMICHNNKQIIEKLANEMNVSSVQLKIVCQLIHNDQAVANLYKFENKLQLYDFK